MKRKRILVVEDNGPLREVILTALSSEDLHIEGVEDGLKALQRLNHHPYDMIITDYEMPGIDGVKLTYLIKSRFPGIIIVGISGNGIEEPFRKAGANAFIPKPFRLQKLLEVVRGLLAN